MTQTAKLLNAKKKRAIKKYLFIASFLIVPLLLLITFTYLPLVGLAGFSFTWWNTIEPPEWVGFQNYIEIFTRRAYWTALVNSLYYLVATFIQLGLALFFAAVLTFTKRFSKIFRAFIFFPFLLNGVAAGLMFRLFFTPEIGTLYAIFQLLGITAPASFLALPIWNNVMLASVSVWRFMGLNFVMFLGVMASVDKELYEAAKLDGANSWQIFWSIIFKSILPVIFLNMILAVRGALTVFEVPYIITGGSDGTSTFVIEAYRISIQRAPLNVGMGSALSIVMLLIVIAATIVQKIFFREDTDV